MGGQDKQVAFEDPHSSASDEDAKAVEVTTSAPPRPSTPRDCTALPVPLSLPLPSSPRRLPHYRRAADKINH